MPPAREETGSAAWSGASVQTAVGARRGPPAVAAVGLVRVLTLRPKGVSVPAFGVERFALEPETAPVLESVLALEKAPRKMPMM